MLERKIVHVPASINPLPYNPYSISFPLAASSKSRHRLYTDTSRASFMVAIVAVDDKYPFSVLRSLFRDRPGGKLTSVQLDSS